MLEVIYTAVVDHRAVTAVIKGCCKVVYWLLNILITIVVFNKLVIDVNYIDFVVVKGEWEDRDRRY